ncbi:MAG: tRNA pseudouridine(55) synthase TruB [Deltaproteobacteria bacterium HGW-Deltaproteobacteria-18]|jgi:tRNA pseudouridine55 synthase|nr:MAG: tRNA pseudouridine(55) synthase TruB [Deltaproteobacteria bacterium HGW-Deltaproteobacteria-20]PKN41086.1 MAG: tRNA pseudouridine(55) synthase TruB [Deltaproteobacteria bacterium HGW-Deltaproteobacteria-18]
MSAPSLKQLDGVLVLHKPGGPTSADCLNQIKRRLGQKKIGHAGTLDPMATGVLVVLLGQGTKLASYLVDGRKTYRGRLILGQTTDSYDTEGKILAEAPWEHLDQETVRAEVLGWKGTISQEVPPVSAAKHQGKPLYALHRAGMEVPVKVKDVTIFDSQLMSMELPSLDFRVTCSAGTYIRSLAHSLGMRLGCGAVLSELEREASHPFTLAQAHDLEKVLESKDQLNELVLPMTQALPHWPKLVLSHEQAALVQNGAWLPTSLFPDYPAQEGDRALMLSADRAPLALMEASMRTGVLSWVILRGLWQA